MRKQFFIFFVLTFILFFAVGCLNKKADDQDPAPTANQIKALENYGLSFDDSATSTVNPTPSSFSVGLYGPFLTPVPDADGWFTRNEKQYKLTTWKTWVDAEQEAVSLGGHLATINDEAENTWLATTFLGIVAQGGAQYGRSGAFIGYYKSGISWKWISGEPVTYTNLFPGFPYGGTHAYLHTADHPYPVAPFTWNAAPWHTDGVYGPAYLLKGIIERSAASLKITQPANNSQFSFGEQVNFVGEKIGDIINLRWTSSIDGAFGTDTLTISKNNLSPGTHTITLSGQAGTPPVASILPGGNPSAAIQAQSGNFSHSITIFVKSGNPKVVKLDFMSAGNNHNRVYDRKGTLAALDAGKQDKFLDPIQWKGKISGNNIADVYNWPLSFVRSGANSVGNGQSKLKINAHFIDLFQSSSLTFDVALTGILRDENNGIRQSFTFNTQTVTTLGDLEAVKEFQSLEGLPDVVGIWKLELNWTFTSGGTLFGSQRIPQAGYQTIYTTWAKPLDTGNFLVGVECIPGSYYCEQMPTYYLEILNFSCLILKGFGSDKTTDEIMTRNLVDTYDRIAGLGYKYSISPPINGVSRRGLDRLLDEDIKNGWCAEWSYIYKALTEAHGINIYSVVGRLKPEYSLDNKYAISADGITHTAPGGIRSMDLEPPDSTRTLWSFKDHHFIVKSADTSSFDPTFSVIGPVYFSYFEDLFEFINSETLFVDVNVLNYVDFDFRN